MTDVFFSVLCSARYSKCLWYMKCRWWMITHFKFKVLKSVIQYLNLKRQYLNILAIWKQHNYLKDLRMVSDLIVFETRVSEFIGLCWYPFQTSSSPWSGKIFISRYVITQLPTRIDLLAVEWIRLLLFKGRNSRIYLIAKF